jgi:hypothetical protein
MPQVGLARDIDSGNACACYGSLESAAFAMSFFMAAHDSRLLISGCLSVTSAALAAKHALVQPILVVGS